MPDISDPGCRAGTRSRCHLTGGGRTGSSGDLGDATLLRTATTMTFDSAMTQPRLDEPLVPLLGEQSRQANHRMVIEWDLNDVQREVLPIWDVYRRRPILAADHARS